MNTKNQIEIDNAKIISNMGSMICELCRGKSISIKEHLIKCSIASSEINNIINDDFDNIEIVTLRKMYQVLGIVLSEFE